MAVPEQVRKQTEAVQQLYEDLNSDPKTPEPSADGVVTEDPDAQAVSSDSVAEGAPEPEPTEPGSSDQEETFEKKYRTLQGMYNADVPRLNAQNQELTQRLESMEQLVASMQAAPPPEAVPAPAPKSLLSDAELEEYGESIDIMRKVSLEIAGGYQQEIDQLKETIKQLSGTLGPRVEEIADGYAHTVEQNFWSDLTRTVPDWRTINENPDFQSWLLEVDPMSGLTRQTFLDDAQKNMDVSRVIGFFTTWQQDNGTVPAQLNRSASQSELEKQTAPGRGRSTGAPKSGEQKTYTREDITDFFVDVQKGKYVGKEDERDKLERDIFAAQRDGRIVNA